jgi:hypothetical protein
MCCVIPTFQVSVHLPYAEYKDVPSLEVVLSVIANLLLVPGEAFMMVGDIVSFKLFYVGTCYFYWFKNFPFGHCRCTMEKWKN